MTKPTSPTAKSGSCAASSSKTPCCLARRGKHDITGQFNRIYRKYGRSKTWFLTGTAPSANLPNGVTWEDFYYLNDYKYELSYETTSVSDHGVEGAIHIRLRCLATVHVSSATLTGAAPGLFTTVTQATIDQAFTGWNKAVQQHWTRRMYTVELGGPKCPGRYVIDFKAVQVKASEDVSFTVLQMTDPRLDPTWGPILQNPTDPLYPTAKELAKEWRSNAGKFNLGDTRGNLVFAHEFGHWMGWGDEYIERSGTMPHPTNPGLGLVDFETRATNVSLRVAVRIKNPTQSYHSKHGSSRQDIDITTDSTRRGLMANMGSPVVYHTRYVYTIVDDFVRMYNKDHHGGKHVAYCIRVLLRKTKTAKKKP